MDGISRVCLYNFKLHVSAFDVYVTGEFDKWSKMHKMIQTSNGLFEKEIALPEFKTLRYWFLVDGVHVLDPSALQSEGSSGSIRNILTIEDCVPGNHVYPNIRRPIYERLDFDNWEIRILSLKLHHGGPMECEMKTVSLFNPGSYNALSYCWGHSRLKDTIVLDGALVDVTPNLYSALKRVKTRFENESHADFVYLWVDALCINQADTEERNSQVRNMFRIYSRAKRVIAFVGEPSRMTNLVSYTSDSIARLLKERFNGQNVTGVDEAPQLSLNLWEWRILNIFFNESYWTRVWVIQEIAVALNVTVLYGDSEIPWTDIAALLTTWKNSPSSLPSTMRAYQRALHLVEFRDRFLIAREPIRLLDALRWSYNTQATDPRDKIFALLGLCYDGQTFVPLPNYKQSFDLIMADMVKNIMRVNRSLDLICFKGPKFPGKKPGPTWLPDCFNLGYESVTPVEQRILEKNSAWNQSPIVDELEDFQLVVKSVMVGTIGQASSSMKPHAEEGISTPYKRGWISETLNLVNESRQLATPSPDDEAKLGELLNTLTMSMASHTLSDEVIRDCFSILWTPLGRGAIHNLDLIRWIDRNAWLEIGKWTLREWSRLGCLPEHPVNQVSATNFATFVECLEKVLGSGMRLFEVVSLDAEEITVGLGPANTEVSDEIHIMNGCSIPVILRKKSESNKTATYHVIGGAYIAIFDGGIMENEHINEATSHSQEGTKTANETLHFSPVSNIQHCAIYGMDLRCSYRSGGVVTETAKTLDIARKTPPRLDSMDLWEIRR